MTLSCTAIGNPHPRCSGQPPHIAFRGPGQPCPAAERRLNSSTDPGEIRKLPLQLTTLHSQPVHHAHAALQLMRRETDKKFQLANQVRLIIKKVAHNVPPIIIAAGDERSNAQRPIFTGKQFWWRTIKPICEPGDLTSGRSEEHTSELQSLMRISYAVLCLKK